MLIRLFLAFTIIPALELYLLIQLGSMLGVLATVAVVLTTGLLGAWMARMEGWNTMVRMQDALRQGRLPADEMLDGILVMVAGVVLITPGFLTDVAGLLLLFPPTRMPVRIWLRRQIEKRLGNRKKRDDDDVIVQQ